LTLLKHVYSTTKTPQPIFNALIPCVSSLTSAQPFPVSIPSTSSLAPLQSNLELIPGLGELQLALLIAAARLEVLADSELVSWEMVYDEYLGLCGKARVGGSGGGGVGTPGGGVGRVWGREVARGAWEGLERVGLIVEDRGRGGGAGGGRWRVDVGLMELREELKGGAWGRWCRV
jgi:origin recognition complex subunit 4